MTFGVMVSGFRVEISFRVTRVWDLGVTVSGFGGWVLSLQYQEFRVWNFEGRVSGVQSLGLRMQVSSASLICSESCSVPAQCNTCSILGLKSAKK